MPHPPHWHWYGNYRYRNMFFGPSRLVWFGIGSVATWAWIHHYERNPHHQRGTWCHRRVDYGRVSDADHGDGERRAMSTAGMSQPNDWQRPMPMGQGTGASTIGPQMQQAQAPVDPDLERLRQMGRNAEETISGMSEATIDSMMSGLQRLKERLAERRGQQLFPELEVQQQVKSTPAPSPEGSPRPRHWV